MYSSLDKIDLVTTEPGGGQAAVLTDHRTRAEIVADPELSVLFAMSRVLVAKHWLKEQAKGDTVVYVAIEDAPPLVRDALAATGALVQVGIKGVRETPAPGPSASELAERAFTGLAARVARRTGVSDPAAVLRALEAETVAAPPDKDADELGFWTRICELMAVTIALVRREHPGEWITAAEQSDVPFGFRLGGGQTVLPGNRAQRFVADGEGETLFLLVGSLGEMARQAERKGPLMPNLRPRAEAIASKMLWRPLLEGVESDALPVIIYGNDGDHTIGWLMASSTTAIDAAHAEALANLARHEVELEQLADGLLVATNSFFATEKVLDVAFIRALHRRIGSEQLAVGVPCRGVLFVAPAARIAALSAVTAAQYEDGGTRRISPLVLLVDDGTIVGFARPGDEPPVAKRGFFSRLLGRR